jgi:hypothetical protein
LSDRAFALEAMVAEQVREQWAAATAGEQADLDAIRAEAAAVYAVFPGRRGPVAGSQSSGGRSPTQKRHMR